MRAAAGGPHEAGGSHISGGERLVPPSEVEFRVQELVRRALLHEKGEPDFLCVTVERVPQEAVRSLSALPISKRDVRDLEEGRSVAVEILAEAGISREAALRAVAWLAQGPAPDGGAMRGAIVMDADTGERLESDPARGVRVSRIDWHPDELPAWQDEVRHLGIANERVAEALALATKVVQTPGTVAELCWSDDPGYVTGYVASKRHGYVRIPFLKERGSPLGGRVFFVRGISTVEEYETALQTPVLLRREEKKRHDV
ncbi:hypothetical protein EL26_12345 [Tumebacillus flagellatus]|uniref:6-carboxyhexanoate--CoA ligase n=2 Tax=Tumebacillus flagellatus TaxID=1157490 RepID=A0A074LRH0_9BACL|nr:hypothetical protein EL26_12345 [Tumebacillus flagellatus]